MLIDVDDDEDRIFTFIHNIIFITAQMIDLNKQFVQWLVYTLKNI